jgi:hypothetical protein
VVVVSTYTFWADSETPANTSNSNSNSNIAMGFAPIVTGSIAAIQFYKISTDTGTHVGTVWRETDQALLGSVTFSGESATGWQTATLSPPVAATGGQRYRVAVSRPAQPFAQISAFTGITVAGVMAMDNTAYYVLGSQTGYPSTSFAGTSFVVDVIFTVP